MSRRRTARTPEARGMSRAATLFAAMLVLAAPGVANADTADDCEQVDIAALALRACTTLLADPNLDEAMKAQIYTLRGAAWAKEEEPAQGVLDFTRTIEISGSHLDAIRGRAKAYETLGKHELAAADFARLIELEPGNEEHYRKRAAAYLAAGKPELALADYGKAIEIKPDNVEAHIGRAQVHVHANDRTQALEDFDRALEIDPKSVPALMARAIVRDSWGENKLAIEDYLAALHNNGMNLKARQALQRLGVDTPPN